jgi:hypothetical protein
MYDKQSQLCQSVKFRRRRRQRIFSFGDDSSNYLNLSPAASAGKLKFGIRYAAGTEQAQQALTATNVILSQRSRAAKRQRARADFTQSFPDEISAVFFCGACGLRWQRFSFVHSAVHFIFLLYGPRETERAVLKVL